MIELNNGQLLAIKRAKKWFLKLDKQIFEIAGFAGTGKSTVVYTLMQELGLELTDVLFTAFVGKAAMILSMKGLMAKTIHSTIYNCMDVPKKDEYGNNILIDGKIVYTKVFMKKECLPPNIKLIVVDEASMVNEKLKIDLMSFGVPIIALGDLHQLPPVFGNAVFLNQPDVVLTEIMRQQADNPIIYLATRARLGLDLKQGEYLKKCLVCKKSDLERDPSFYKYSDIVICGTNKTRSELNEHIRHNVFNIETNEIIYKDKLICRQNNWNESIQENIFLINGMIGFVDNINMESFNGRSIEIDFRPEFITGNCFSNIAIDYKFLHMEHEKKKTYFTRFNKFEFGYAITCHLSQGSQYNKVLVYNERMGDRTFYSKWLYTALTRAIDKLVVAC